MNTPVRPHLVVLDDEKIPAEMAQAFLREGAAAIAARGVFTVALAGGSTPKTANALLASLTYRDRLAWANVRFFFGDERCVPPDHPDSNYRMAKETLLDPLRIAETSVFRMHGEDEPAVAAASYAQTLRDELAPGAVFDLVMLGMGPDGHTASLFPGHSPDDGGDDLVQVRLAPASMRVRERLTVTPKVINAARAVLIAATGAAKAQTLAAVIDGAYDPTTYPVQIVRPSSGRLTWLVDQAAASLLRQTLC